MPDTESADRRRGAPGDDRIRILIGDDHALFRAGIVNVLAREKDFEVVGEAADGRSAIEASNALTPNIVLMDLSLPQPGGIETTQRIRRELPATAVIVMAQDEDEESLFASIKAGAAAVVIKDISPEDLVTVIRRVSKGEVLINDKVFS